MKIVGPAIAGVLLVAGLTGCASYSRTERAYAYTAPGYAYTTPSSTAVVYTTTPAPAYGYTYYSTTPRYAYTSDGGYYADGVYHPPAVAHTTGTSGDNYYRSRSDYYRNYNGIHGGPERTDGPARWR